MPRSIPANVGVNDIDATGTPSATTYLRGDGSWSTPTGGSGVSDGDYGDITVSGTGTVFTIDNDVVTYAKMQNVSATDKVLGRSSGGSGDVEEIACTAAGRALLDDADAAAQRTTLGLGSLATQSGTFSGTSSGTNTGDQTLRLTFPIVTTSRMTLTNMAAAATWMTGVIGAAYVKTDLAGYSSVRLTAYVSVTGSAGSKIRVGYDLSPSTPPVIGDFSADIGTSEVSVSIASTGFKDTGWIALAASAKANDVYFTFETSGGDGVADPSIASLVIEFKT